MPPLYKNLADRFLEPIRGIKLSREERSQKAVELAALLSDATLFETTKREKRQEAWMARMMNDSKGRLFLTSMTDQCFRSNSDARTADQLLFLLKKYKIPEFLNDSEKCEFLTFRLLGGLLPSYFIPMIRANIRKKMSDVLLPEGKKENLTFLKHCYESSIRININHLGEAILGEEEALKRLNIYLDDLKRPEIEYISIKISTICSQINMIGYSDTLDILAERMRLLYRACKEHLFLTKNGDFIEKFVNLDMEEYKDLDLTAALFQKVLSEPEFLNTHAGIVLQSYLPDSFSKQHRLTEWAKERVENGGAPIKIRLVKGANLAMEAVEASKKGWEQAPFETKEQSDANFKKMLEYAVRPENLKAVHIGIASHNLFDIAYGLILRAETKGEKVIHFEMLKGMAPPMQRILLSVANEILLYCPEAKESDFRSALAYLIRRFDENCGPDNFLHHLFKLKSGSSIWEKEKRRFLNSCISIDPLSCSPRRQQNRNLKPKQPDPNLPFENESDTDFSLSQNREWADQIFDEWEHRLIPPIPLVIAGEEIETLQAPGYDPSKPKVPRYHYHLADLPLIESALDAAEKVQQVWRNSPFEEKSALLAKAAQRFREKRKELIGAMILDGGKTISEADPEVSEAVDFIEYYRKTWKEELQHPGLSWTPKGNVLVATPWNFPCSIPCGGIAAALTAGNCVLFKPAPEAVLVGWHLVQCFWEAGISKSVLQFINCKEDPVGNYLIKHPKLNSIILTGATETALKFFTLRPGIDLQAETGGKNAIIVTAMSDRDLAIRDIVASAFGHSGQKCSACSLVVLEEEVYHDPNFKRQLHDAAASLHVSSAWNKSATVTPLIRPPDHTLKRGLTQLEEGESWLLKPKQDPLNPHLWSPGIKWGVNQKNFTFHTELFGPILGVMCAKNLEEAIDLVNSTRYGLTSGLHSLDEREQVLWKNKIEAGNLYINRGITGAIVQRQPFGGCKASSFGQGAKTGGPNYVKQLSVPLQITLPNTRTSLPTSLTPVISLLSTFNLSGSEKKIWMRSVENYAYWIDKLTKPIDPRPVLGQHNLFYHLPQNKCILRLQPQDTSLPFLQVIAACLICRTPLEISTSSPLSKIEGIEGVKITQEDEETLFAKRPEKIRMISFPSDAFKDKAAIKGTVLQVASVSCWGEIELLNYLREVSLSIEYHRYGYLGSHRANL